MKGAVRQAEAGARLTIDPQAVASNWGAANAASRAACGAVLKADAYGLGVSHVARALWSRGCRRYFVATVAEGLALRETLTEATIFVLNGVFEDARLAIDARLLPFISSREALAQWPAGAPFALNVDTGMNRLGLTPEEAAQATDREPVLLASHFACADEPGHPLNARQEQRFASVRAVFPKTPASLANSAALLSRPAAHYDLTRPGIALYGCPPVPSPIALAPSVRLEARIIQVRDVAAGETVGYGAAQTARRAMRIAIVSCGYADGFLRAAGGTDALAGAPAFFEGRSLRLFGRVSMDLIAIEVTETAAQRGDWVELFGPNVPLEEVAARAGTIPYEFLTGLSRRAERRYGPL